MHVVRTFRMSAFVAAAALTLGALSTGAAEAGKPPPRPTGLQATVTPHAGGTYDVATTWNAVANATAYKVSITKGGQTLASKSVTTTSWSPTVTSTPGTATLNVRALVGRRQGKPAALGVTLPDVTGPTGSYTSKWENTTGVATVTQSALADDSGAAGVTRTINWHQTDGSADVAWPSGTTVQHTYPLVEQRYLPTVTLTDAAGNKTVVDVPAVVIKDETAPTGGAYSISETTAWATLTQVTVHETSAPSDLYSPEPFITRTVDWGDGTEPTPLSAGSAAHVYATAGTFHPVVTIADEAHNTATVDVDAVVVAADTTAPKVSVAAAKPAHSVKAWRTLRGKATDTAGTGVKTVSVKAIEMRGTAWYGYSATTHKWLKAATKAKALKRAVAFSRTTDARHRWSAALRGLAKGTLVVRASAADLVGNHSASVTRSARLTTR